MHVRYVEKEKRHWASLENFASQRIAIGEKFYRDNDRLLEGGIWAEVVIAHNDVDADEYAFYVEDLRPIQLSRFDFAGYGEAKKGVHAATNGSMSCCGPSAWSRRKLSKRVKLHFIARLAPLVEPNFNFIELGPRGTGKSYFFSEFSPYSTLISGGQATKSVLFYNNARRKIGLVGFWDTVAFDEVGGIKIKDPDTIQIMKDYMANGRFSRGVEVIADASMAFVGNIDMSVEQIVNSTEYDLFQPLPEQFDLAVMDRFACYLPGWEMPKNSSAFLTDDSGSSPTTWPKPSTTSSSTATATRRSASALKLGAGGRRPRRKGHQEDPLRASEDPAPCGFARRTQDFDEYVAYAIECRRRVKGADEQAQARRRVRQDRAVLLDKEGKEIVVHCPETVDASATLEPAVAVGLQNEKATIHNCEPTRPRQHSSNPTSRFPLHLAPEAEAVQPTERHYTIIYGDTGYSYDTNLWPVFNGGKVGRCRGSVHPPATPDRQFRPFAKRWSRRPRSGDYPRHLLRSAD